MSGLSGYVNSLSQYRMSEDWAGHLARGSRGGIDYAAGMGSPIPAPCDGRLENRPNNGNQYGNYIRFHHGDGFVDEYLHLKDGGFVAEGNYKQGQIIGYSGSTGNSTGPHVHWHLIDPSGNRVNPLDYIDSNPQPLQEENDDMKHVGDSVKKWTYLIGAGYLHCNASDTQYRDVKWQFGEAKMHGSTADFKSMADAFGIPASVVDALKPGQTWSKAQEIQDQLTASGFKPGTSLTPVDVAAIATAVNNETSKRLAN